MKEVRERIPRLRILVLPLLVVCSCNGNGIQILTGHDAGSTGGSGGVIATGGSGQNAGGGGSSGATGMGGMVGSSGGMGGTGNTGGASGSQGTSNNHALGANQCRGDKDCDVQQDETCVPPGGQGPCGICEEVASPCTSDSECQGDGAASNLRGARGVHLPARHQDLRSRVRGFFGLQHRRSMRRPPLRPGNVPDRCRLPD